MTWPDCGSRIVIDWRSSIGKVTEVTALARFGSSGATCGRGTCSVSVTHHLPAEYTGGEANTLTKRSQLQWSPGTPMVAQHQSPVGQTYRLREFKDLLLPGPFTGQCQGVV